MIQINSYIKVVDNSGIRIVKCLGILNNNNSNKLKLGDIFIGSIKKLNKKYKNEKIKKGNIVSCVLVQNKIFYKKKNNIKIKFFSNSCIILNDQKLPMGTKIFCSIIAEVFRKKKLYKILILTKKILI